MGRDEMKKLCKNCIYDSLSGHDKTYKPGEVIFHEGATLDNIVMIESGLVKVSKLFISGEEKIFDILGPKDYVGLVALLKEEPEYIASATALNDVVVKVIDKTTVLKAYEDSDFFKSACLNCTMTRMNTFQNQLFQSANIDTEEKILHVLIYLAKKFGLVENEQYRLKLPFTKTVLASIVGIRRETLSRNLSKMVDEGLIELDQNVYKFYEM